ncbi:recombination protein RecR [Mycoplasmopsis californica]|uniref:Recombination protein RecR n=1 Tax=Mycoplasmopsis equigenitalium TaxID=114883 RepID=A0ABY5J1R8_9BACT|nr:toprim domain-containing protein [Mycoplasmopsis equigenitalium]UUD37197.1 toprim domain-containing protein [Mycoplasmopsis equigenitalium]VEU69499.1 recombination protein RecR [Mycoplasmopsis californica]
MENHIINELNQALSNLPGITKKTAAKISQHLLKMEPQEVANLIKAIEKVKNYVFICDHCHYIATDYLCNICLDNNRNKNQLMIVETINDVDKIEQGEFYNGEYFVWEQAIDKKQNAPLELKSNDWDYINTHTNIILALSPNLQGEIKSEFLINKLKNKNISKLAIGLPFGSQIDYIDEITLKQAFENRKKI